MMDPKKWLEPSFDEETRNEVKHLMKENPKALEDAFCQNLSFGTGGMRGLMGVGTNRMNVYTIRAATDGLARYLCKAFRGSKKVFIGYDTRKHSRLFAEECAKVLAAYQIEALVAKEVCPTPLVSFACRHFGCSSAIMITASHNPPAYNGYKVYWNDGGQVTDPHDAGIVKEASLVTDFAKIPLSPSDSPLIRWVGGELDSAYLKELAKLKGQSYPLKILYTPLHGTGIRIAKEALHAWGFDHMSVIKEQAAADPNFTHAPSPNPEEESAMKMGMEELVKTGSDLLLATDPDADRMGVAILSRGKPHRFTGHQIAVLLLHHLCTTRTIPSNSACIKTIVTTELFKKIATHFRLECFDVLTGFKYIGEKMTAWEKRGPHFLFGAEESYGYLYGTMTRDKDGINACCLMAEAASLAKHEGIDLSDRLEQIYKAFGIHREAVKGISFPNTLDGMGQMKQQMDRLRAHPPKSFCNTPVAAIEDYLQDTSLPKSDVLRFWLKDQTKIVIRPSGTEPKVKVYAEVVEDSRHPSIAECDERLKRYLQDCLDRFGSI